MRGPARGLQDGGVGGRSRRLCAGFGGAARDGHIPVGILDLLDALPAARVVGVVVRIGGVHVGDGHPFDVHRERGLGEVGKAACPGDRAAVFAGIATVP